MSEQKRRGRPPLDVTRGNVTSVRLSDREHDLCITAATDTGVSLSTYLRDRGVAAAKRHAKKTKEET